MAAIESLLRDAAVSGVVLGPDGTILEVSDGWMRVADGSGFAFPNHGVGLNYLKYCITNDPQSLDVLRGIKKVLDRQTGAFTTFYPCHTPDSKRWFMMAAFAPDLQNTRTPLIHIDVSHLYDAKHWSGIEEFSFFSWDPNKLIEELRRTVVEAIAAGKKGALESPTAANINPSDERRLSRLTPRQREILDRLALGETNAEIARALTLTTSIVKAQVAGTLRKLEFANRTQAALYANRLSLGRGREPKSRDET